jgi:hypothetical protein
MSFSIINQLDEKNIKPKEKVFVEYIIYFENSSYKFMIEEIEKDSFESQFNQTKIYSINEFNNIFPNIKTILL